MRVAWFGLRFCLGQCLGQFWPMLGVEIRRLCKRLHARLKSDYVPLCMSWKRYPLCSGRSQPDRATESLLADIVLGGKPKEFLCPLGNGLTNSRHTSLGRENYENPEAFPLKLLLELPTEMELEIELNLSLPDSGTLGSEVHFKEHGMNRSFPHKFEVTVRHQRNRWRERLMKRHPPLAREARREPPESRLNEDSVYGLLVGEKLAARDDRILLPGDESLPRFADQGCALR